MGLTDWIARGIKRKTSTEPAMAVLFADVCGSTKLYEKLGDQHAFDTIRSALQSMTVVVTNHGGRVVKTVGDEIMAVFPNPARAADASAAMHYDFLDSTKPGGMSEPIAIHIGFHVGPAIEHDGDVFGDSVNIASRLVELSNPRQTLISKTALAYLGASWQQRARPLAVPPLKGKTAEVAVYELLWRDKDEITEMSYSEMARKPSSSSLVLRYRGRSIVLDASHQVSTLGRDDTCSLMVDAKLASRVHARVERRQDKFVIVDQSLNGTWVKINGNGQALSLRREEMILPDAGTISLGSPVGEAVEHEVRFEIM